MIDSFYADKAVLKSNNLNTVLEEKKNRPNCSCWFHTKNPRKACQKI
jgi:hypothetical protein